MPLCFFDNNNNNKNDDYIYVHNSVTSYIRHLCPDKQHWQKTTMVVFILGSKNLDWKKTQFKHIIRRKSTVPTTAEIRW